MAKDAFDLALEGQSTPTGDAFDQALSQGQSSANADAMSQREQKLGLLGGTGSPMSREDAINLSRERFVNRANLEGQPNIQLMDGKVVDVNQLSPLGKALLSVPRAFSSGQNFGITDVAEKGLENVLLGAGLTTPEVVSALGVGSQKSQETPLDLTAALTGGLATGIGTAKTIGQSPGLLKRVISSGSTGAQAGALSELNRQLAQGENINPTSIAENAGTSALLSSAISTIPAVAGKISSLKPTIKDYGETYRKILAPSKQEIKNIEIRSNKNLSDPYELAAKEGLIIEKSPDGKLDTRNAIDQLQESIVSVQEELSNIIASKPQKQFDINDVANNSKKEARQVFKNDADYEDAVSTIDKEVNAIIKNRGSQINGVDLNQIKQGMWSKGYNAMAPNANKIARIIGNEAKDAIEKAYNTDDIKGLNSTIGDYITLQKILENAHGRVVARGKLGKYASQGIGAMAGHALGIPVAGELGGAYLGGKINDILTDPARITRNVSKKVQ